MATFIRHNIVKQKNSFGHHWSNMFILSSFGFSFFYYHSFSLYGFFCIITISPSLSVQCFCPLSLSLLLTHTHHTLSHFWCLLTLAANHWRVDLLGCWDEFVQKARFKKLVCLCHIKQNNLTYLGWVCTPFLSVSTGIYALAL